MSRLLEYTPSARITPLQACAHTFFDELREPGTKLPNGRDLPLLFNFTEQVHTGFFSVTFLFFYYFGSSIGIYSLILSVFSVFN